MASKLVQVQSKACEASKFVAKHGTSYYRQLLEKNKHYIQEPATVEKCQELSKQLLYTRLARLLSLSLSLSLFSLLSLFVVIHPFLDSS